jgi:hypothetical protein
LGKACLCSSFAEGNEDQEIQNVGAAEPKALP